MVVGPLKASLVALLLMSFLHSFTRGFSAGTNFLLGATTNAALVRSPVKNRRHNRSFHRARTHHHPRLAAFFSSKISISDAYDGGNIELVSVDADNANPWKDVVSLRIKPDPYTELEKKSHMQY